MFVLYAHPRFWRRSQVCVGSEREVRMASPEGPLFPQEQTSSAKPVRFEGCQERKPLTLPRISHHATARYSLRRRTRRLPAFPGRVSNDMPSQYPWWTEG